MPNSENVLKLKEEGNALFSKTEFSRAYEKYTAAINVDGRNAILYANRAACCLSMNRYLDAASDARKATEIDPTYSKAWGRLAVAHQETSSWAAAADAWKRALSSLPQKNLSQGELRQREQYTSGLKEAQRRDAIQTGPPESASVKNDVEEKDYPGHRAQSLTKEWMQRADGEFHAESSAWVILGAYIEFCAGYHMMQEKEGIVAPNFPSTSPDPNMALVHLSNALLRDIRAFQVRDSRLQERFNFQVIIETKAARAWVDGGPQRVLEEAQVRIRSEGWDSVRPALSITVRTWIMRAFTALSVSINCRVAVELYENAIELIECGRRLWKNVGRTVRGAIFDDTFLRGVRVRYLDAFMQAYAESPGPESPYPLVKLQELADDLLDETRRAKLPAVPEADSGFYTSFYTYPSAEALAIKGFCHKRMALDEDNDPGERLHHWTHSASFYLTSARTFPVDDEHHCWYLSMALTSLWQSRASLKVTLPVMAQMRDGIQKMKKIWEHSLLSTMGRDDRWGPILEFEANVLEGLRQGRFTTDAIVLPMGEKDAVW